MIIPNFIFRINYFFQPKEKASVYVAENDDQETIKAGFLKIASERYPNTFDPSIDVLFWATGTLLVKTYYVGDVLGIKAFYTITPSLMIPDKKHNRFFELKEIHDEN